jgi:hypothetical protein
VALTDGSGGSVNLVNGTPVTFDYLAHVFQDVASAQVSGELFSLWAKPWSLAAGAEYRRERSREEFDPFTQLGLSSGNQLSNTIGSIGVKEAFVEIVAPIMADRPGSSISVLKAQHAMPTTPPLAVCGATRSAASMRRCRISGSMLATPARRARRTSANSIRLPARPSRPLSILATAAKAR